jgi:hypothetical protein
MLAEAVMPEMAWSPNTVAQSSWPKSTAASHHLRRQSCNYRSRDIELQLLGRCQLRQAVNSTEIAWLTYPPRAQWCVTSARVPPPSPNRLIVSSEASRRHSCMALRWKMMESDEPEAEANCEFARKVD